MKRLTLRPQLANNCHTAAKSAVGFSSLKQLRGASAPKPLGAFFTPKGFLFGGMQWEAFGLAGFHVLRSANPLYAVTTIFSRIGCRLVNNQYVENLIMSTPLFVPRGDITPAECRDYVRIYAFQAQALTRLIDDALIESVAGEISKETHDRLGWVLWVLSDVLHAQIALCERLESQA